MLGFHKENRTGGRGETLIVAFSLGFILYLLSVLPIILHHHGMFFYYGDYNVQQVPFYIMAHRAVRSGETLWNWKLDLGGSMIGDFAFYLWGSPFFWLTIPFPEKAIPYLMPVLMALKFGTAALNSAIYLRRYVHREIPLMIGALLYAFSGFQACCIVFQHFADVVAFFPLYIASFDDLMAVDAEGQGEGLRLSGPVLLKFALMSAFMSILNYYFFFGQVIFFVIYFFVRYARTDLLHTTYRRFLRALCGGGLGVLIASFFLMQAFFGVTGNRRISDILTGYNIIVYESMKLPYAIVKSLVMVPDIIGKGTLFFTEAIRNSSLAGYLPMFGLTGVAAFLFSCRRRGDWRKTLFITCAIIAMVPFFNAAFSLFNNNYYARWFYMPILFMAMVTAQQLERGQLADMKLGTILSIILFLFMLTVALLPSKNSEGEVVYLNMTDNPSMFWHQVEATGVMLLLLILIVYLVKGRALKNLAFLGATILACWLTTFTVLHNGAGLINDFGMTEWKKQMIDTRPELEDGTFFRIETDSTSTNYEMAWGLPTIHCFLSTVPSQIFDFYDGIGGIERGVESDAPLSRIGMRAILSARYYLENSAVNDSGEFSEGRGMPGYVYREDQNDFAIYENKNYIPMGFTYHYYVRKSVFDTVTRSDADRMLVKALVLSDRDAERYGALMNELPDNEITEVMSDEVFAMECAERRQSACTRFETDTRGFSATTANLPEENLVFFAVPAAKGFTATLDGRRTKIIRADYGLMAIDVPAGVHEIRVDYHPAGRTAGRLLTVLGILLTAAYVILYRRGYQAADLSGIVSGLGQFLKNPSFRKGKNRVK